MCGLDCTMNVAARHARARDRLHLRHAPRRAPRGDRALQRDLRLRASRREQGRPTSRSAASSRRPTTSSSTPGWGCMSADFVLKDGGKIIYCSPSPGVSTAIGDFPGLALMDLMKPYMPPTPRELPARAARHPHAHDPDVGRLHLGADLRGHDAQAADDGHARGEPRDGRRHRHRGDDVARRGVRRGDGAHGPDAKVIVLPFARYQLPRNAIRMDADDARSRRRRVLRARPSRGSAARTSPTRRRRA